MKKISFVFAVAMLLSAGNVFASVDPTEVANPKAKIGDQIESLLEEQSGFILGDAEELSATVRFMLNEHKEIIVLTVDTQDERLKRFVKARLNYRLVEDKNLTEGKTYKVPIRVRA